MATQTAKTQWTLLDTIRVWEAPKGGEFTALDQFGNQGWGETPNDALHDLLRKGGVRDAKDNQG